MRSVNFFRPTVGATAQEGTTLRMHNPEALLSVNMLWRSGPSWLSDAGGNEVVRELSMPEECTAEMKARTRDRFTVCWCLRSQLVESDSEVCRLQLC